LAVPPDSDVFWVLWVRYIMKISSSADIDSCLRYVLPVDVEGRVPRAIHRYKEGFGDFFIVPPDSDVFKVLWVRLDSKISSSSDADYTQTLYFRWWRLSKRFHCKKSGFL
jgi:hypothetical protein